VSGGATTSACLFLCRVVVKWRIGRLPHPRAQCEVQGVLSGVVPRPPRHHPPGSARTNSHRDTAPAGAATVRRSSMARPTRKRQGIIIEARSELGDAP
jgi:hypothetical protein